MKQENVKISYYNLKYLTKIITLCKNNNIRVILIRSPQHKKYSGYSNEIKYQEIRKQYFPSIEYIDFSKFPLKNSEFGDLEHLNYKGAAKFSNWFNELLRMNFLEKNNKQDIINEEIKTRLHNMV